MINESACRKKLATFCNDNFLQHPNMTNGNNGSDEQKITSLISMQINKWTIANVRSSIRKPNRTKYWDVYVEHFGKGRHHPHFPYIFLTIISGDMVDARIF